MARGGGSRGGGRSSGAHAARGATGRTSAIGATHQALKSKGVPPAQAFKAAQKHINSGGTAPDIGAIVSSALQGVPFVGPLASNLLEQSNILTPSGGMGGAQRGGSRGLKVVDFGSGKVLRSISAEDYFYLKSLKNRRGKIRGHRPRQVAIIKSGETVVKL